MADISLYYFFHVLPLIVLVAMPLAFIVRPIRWGFEKIEHVLMK